MFKVLRTIRKQIVVILSLKDLSTATKVNPWCQGWAKASFLNWSEVVEAKPCIWADSEVVWTWFSTKTA